MQSSYMSVCEVCRELGGISKSTFYARVAPELERLAEAQGEAPVVRIGRRRLIRRHIFVAFLRALARSCG